MTDVVCVMCPVGCRLKVDEQNGYAVSGNRCPRGEAYGKAELTDPRRALTSTVRVKGGVYARCPVKTSAELPKPLIFQAMGLLNAVELQAPVTLGQVVLKDVLGSGVDFVATRAIAAE